MKREDVLQQILPHLRVVKGPDGRGDYTAWCPFHADGQGKPPHEPNLKVGPKGYICFVCDAKGSLRELAKRLGLEVGASNGTGKWSRVAKWYDYRDEQGRLLFQVGRMIPKGFTQRRPDGKGGWVGSLDGTRRVVYHLPELLTHPDEAVWITEGEKDVDRLRKLGLLATTNPGGAGKWRSEYSELLRDRDVVIVPDNDQPGQSHAQKVAQSLTGTAASVKIVRLHDLVHKGDVSDWLDLGYTVEELRSLVDASEASAPSNSVLSTESVDEADDDPHRLARLFVVERCSDATGRLTLRHWRHQWWQWIGTHYEVLDKDELRALLAGQIKAEVDRCARLGDSSKPPRRVTHQLVTNVLQALSGMVLVPFKLDQPTWLGETPNAGCYISMTNGLLDVERFLSGAGSYLIEHTPEWFSQHHLPYAFDPGAECPLWLAFLGEVLERDQERIGRLQEWFGYCLLPDTSFQKFLVLEGEGANGKSVVCAIHADLLGRPNVSHVPLERFGDRFQLTMTLGKLANIASEVGDLDKAAEGVLKAFTAGDRMGFDRKGIAGVEAFPTARLVLATNNRPRFSDRSSGLWRRMLLILFRVSIPENQQDTKLADNLRSELPGIFCWALAGLHRLRRNGQFTKSALGDEALEEYRAEVNPARLFLTERCYEDPGGFIACESLYGSYKSWCDANGYHPLGERMFGKEVIRVFPAVTRTKKGPRERREYRYEGVLVSHVS
ncbi:MAG: phage/plasmid primase, P4 family [bacterium]